MQMAHWISLFQRSYQILGQTLALSQCVGSLSFTGINAKLQKNILRAIIYIAKQIVLFLNRHSMNKT